uniref:Post-GPI attachment to proteins factor 2 n=1 Tax=Panagrolaimus davidi TaxID=227884 RepID=A0A914PUX6_9BILA
MTISDNTVQPYPSTIPVAITFDDKKVPEIIPQKPEGRIRIRTLCFLGALLPGLGCYFCIAYTYLFQFDRVLNFTSSHCPNVKSPFPPVSYSIGVWEPQKFIWLLVLCVHIPPRLFFAMVYKCQYRLGRSIHQKEEWFPGVARAHMRFLFLEPLGLIIVSVVDIDSHFFIHSFGYALWLISFNFNMLLNTILHHYSGFRDLHDYHDTTFQLKRLMFIIGCPVSISTAVTYLTYAVYCFNFSDFTEDFCNSYAAFSIAEYIMVGFNSAFYFLIIWEMGESHIDLTVGNIKPALMDA